MLSKASPASRRRMTPEKIAEADAIRLVAAAAPRA